MAQLLFSKQVQYQSQQTIHKSKIHNLFLSKKYIDNSQPRNFMYLFENNRLWIVDLCIIFVDSDIVLAW